MHFETTVSHFIPPVVGALALVGGIVLLRGEPQTGLMSGVESGCRHESKNIGVVLHKLPSGKSPATALEEQLNHSSGNTRT